MKEFKAYQCDFCNKYGKQKSRIKKHEESCYHNPMTRSCATCIHLKQQEFSPVPNGTLLDNQDPESMAFGESSGWVDYIPVCKEGVDISQMDDGGKEVYLKTQCPLWEDKVY